MGWLLLGFITTGCVTYTPVPPEAVPPGEEVRVRLTDAGAIRAARHFGRIRTELDASIDPSRPDSLEVVVWLGRDYPGTSFENVRETVVFPEDEISDVSVRELSVLRTAATAVGAVTVFAVLADRIFFQEDPNPSDPGDDENPPPAGFTFIRIPIGRTP